MRTVKDSNFFELLLQNYSNVPSVILCRVPELELFSQIELVSPILDHCCGDGYITATAFPNQNIDAGVDLNQQQIEIAKQRGNYQRLENADASVHIPFRDGEFNTIINNSGIEHIKNLDAAIAEISRVLNSGGKLYMNVLNNRYFERWPLATETAKNYKKFQPFYHALNEKQWQEILEKYQFKDIQFTNYFPEETSKILSCFDYEYSAHYFRKKISLKILLEKFLPKSWLIKRWRKLFENLIWEAQVETGSGFLISATKI